MARRGLGPIVFASADHGPVHENPRWRRGGWVVIAVAGGAAVSVRAYRLVEVGSLDGGALTAVAAVIAAVATAVAAIAAMRAAQSSGATARQAAHALGHARMPLVFIGVSSFTHPSPHEEERDYRSVTYVVRDHTAVDIRGVVRLSDGYSESFQDDRVTVWSGADGEARSHRLRAPARPDYQFEEAIITYWDEAHILQWETRSWWHREKDTSEAGGSYHYRYVTSGKETRLLTGT